MCVTPFLAVRKGELIVMPDQGSLLSHFTAVIDAYRGATGAKTWEPRSMDEDGEVVLDTWTSYQLLSTADG